MIDIHDCIHIVIYIHIVLYSNILPCTHVGSCYAETHVILTRGVRSIKTFINKEYDIQAI